MTPGGQALEAATRQSPPARYLANARPAAARQHQECAPSLLVAAITVREGSRERCGCKEEGKDVGAAARFKAGLHMGTTGSQAREAWAEAPRADG